jgi:penicillin amidase
MVVRDRFGIPHITASNTDDLFLAQGFVQAQDRLFQMDLWKRSAQGRLSEVLGANFIQRDSMTRRIQFRGDLEREWAAYGPGAHAIAVAFVRGINAWVRRARQAPPEEFVAAGWLPEFWRPEDLLTRTDAFLASRGAQDALLRARLAAAIGPARTDQILPPPNGQPIELDPDVALDAITFAVSDAVRRIGTPPFFLTLTGPVSAAPRPGQPAAAAAGAADGASAASRDMASAGSGDIGLSAADGPSSDVASTDSRRQGVRARLRVGPPTTIAWGSPGGDGASVGVVETGGLGVPASRYLVHLTAPGWNVIGATSPWLPGVAIGHNEHLAWAMSPASVDTQDIFVERVNPENPHQVLRDGRWVDMQVDYERVDVKGRPRPVEYERQYTANGVVIAQDRARHLVYTLRWTGTDPGGAGELAALAFNQAVSADEFQAALRRWIAPPADFVLADAAGGVRRLEAGGAPIRGAKPGIRVSSAWVSDRMWRGSEPWSTSTRRGRRPEPSRQVEIIGDRSRSQAGFVSGVLLGLPGILPSNQIEDLIRRRLLSSGPGQLFDELDLAVRLNVSASSGVPKDLQDEVAASLDVGRLVSAGWLATKRDRRESIPKILSEALKMMASWPDVVAEASREAPSSNAVTFSHSLSVFDAAIRRFSVGPVARPEVAPADLPAAVSWQWRRSSGFSARFDVAQWNRSVVRNPPGQSGSPSSPHYDDLASAWASRADANLLFDQFVADQDSSTTLTLQP